MDIDFKKLAPWNWFKKEQEEQQSTASLPVQRNDLPVAGGPVSPILQLHREIDRLFDDAFRGFGFPTLAMPRWPSDWPGMLKPALDIQETDKQYKIALEVPGIEEKDIQITLDNDVLLVGVLSQNRRNFRHPSSSPATSASRSIILPSLWKV